MCDTNTDNNRWRRKAGIAVITPIVVFALVFGPVFGFAPQTAQGNTHTQQAQQQAQQQGQQQQQQLQNSGLDCTVFNGTQGFVDCIVVLSYYIIVWPATTILGLVGIVFDFSIQINLDNFGLTDSFVEETWGVTRDVANLFFIFILLYAGIATMLQLSNIDTRRIIVLVILVAVLVNFSLFFTRVVIDVGNGFADVFYQSVSSGSASISEQYARFLGIQELLSSDAFDQVQDADRLLFIPVFLAYAGIALFAAWVLAQVTALMFVRIAVLIFLMITAPIAFVAFIIPKTRSLVSDKWWGELIGKAFMPAIFLFFLFIIFSAGASFTNGIEKLFVDQSEGVFSIIAKVLVQASVLVAMLMIAKNVTVAASGQLGKGAASIGSKALGFATAGVGGAALRRTVGAGAKNLAERARDSGWGQRAGGRMALRALDSTAGASFEARSLAPKGAGLGKARGKGGYTKTIHEKKVKKDEKFIRSLRGDTDEIKTDEQGNPVTDDEGNVVKVSVQERAAEKMANRGFFARVLSNRTKAQSKEASKKALKKKIKLDDLDVEPPEKPDEPKKEPKEDE